MKRLETIVSEEKSSWKYDVLYSCPYVIVFGKTRIDEYECFAVLPVLNHRFNILVSEKENLVIHNIPSSFPYMDLVMNTCMFFIGETKCSENDLCKVLWHTYYYGGYIVFIKIGEEIHPLNIEVVNTEKLVFYYKPIKESFTPEHSYKFLSLLGIALRLGEIKLVKNLCQEPNCVYRGNSLVLKTLNGELVIMEKNGVKHLPEYYYIVPDNNPARNVVKIN